MMTTPSTDELALLHNIVFQALGDPKRIQILYALSQQPCHVSALACALATPQSTISRHLRVLRQRSLVLTERDGPAVIYRLADSEIIEILEGMRQILRKNLERQSQILT